MASLQIATTNVEPQLVEMMVPLYSHGCAKKVRNTLAHLKGIYSVNVEYKEQKVTVWGICNKYQVLSTVRSKRKAARFWNPEEEEHTTTSQTPLSPPLDLRPSFTLNKLRSLSFKLACRKVFTVRSYSLPTM